MTVIAIKDEFSRYPAGRYREDGPYNGQRFREDFLVPALQQNADKILIKLDGVRGYNSSFLDEAFGGLVRNGFSAAELLNRLQLESQDKSLIEEIKGYIKDQSNISTSV
ncbi:MAG: STAS-like domain-containing protein [Proteobacteria bacterium]|nr:STAS-like domain-containing protein [Pseudomonadota bacterium]